MPTTKVFILFYLIFSVTHGVETVALLLERLHNTDPRCVGYVQIEHTDVGEVAMLWVVRLDGLSFQKCV